MKQRSRAEGLSIALGVAFTNAVLLVYGLIRPDSLEFSLAFLIAPSLALLWTVVHSSEETERRVALLVTWGTVAGAVAVAVINWLR